MFLKSLRTYKFRNLEDTEIFFAPRANFIVGDNGQGKTNLLEAISFLSTTKSFRTSKAKELVQADERALSVFGKIVQQNNEDADTHEYELGISVEDGQKTAFVNGEKAGSVSSYLEKMLTVSFTPDDIFLIKGGPAERRKFLDKHIVDRNPQALSFLVDAGKALQHKNELLRRGRADERSLAPWNKIIADTSFKIRAARRAFIEDIQEFVQEFHEGIATVAHDDVRLALESNLREDLESPEAIYAFLQEKADSEIRFNGNLYGPQRDELKIFLGEKDARVFASQGQVRTLVLSLKLAVVRLLENVHGTPPIVLFDDVDAELDPQRSQALFDLITGLDRQVIITGTHISAKFSEIEPKVLRIHGGILA